MSTPDFLRLVLPSAIPLAVIWAKEQEAIILRTGTKLNPALVKIARKVGVLHPELVRVQIVHRIPEPRNTILAVLARAVQLITPNTVGITFQHGIYVRQDCSDDLRLHAHELAHVGQYERLGGIQAFMTQYCQQVVEFGYENAPMEAEARVAEGVV